MSRFVVLVCGSRDYTDIEHVCQQLDLVHATRGPITRLVHGGYSGADLIAGDWAEISGIPCQPYKANWKTYGRAAGPMRNRAMLLAEHPDLVVAFPRDPNDPSPGTANMIAQAEEFGVAVLVSAAVC